ncbi:XRE family transcriptional regulator [Coralliovum pocilloporae]|uniref:XRE family transcriptional regulator n=1 Tax=Coralliovum pocilloporae TaxID=3066369 RepID=UPI003307884D
MNGSVKPSGFNLQKICSFFGVTSGDLLGDHDELQKRFRKQGDIAPPLPDRINRLIRKAFPGDRQMLKRYLGYYHSYFVSTRDLNIVVRSLIHLSERDGFIHSKTIERSAPGEQASRFISKYEGLVSFHADSLFISEFESLSQDSVVETILFPPYRRGLQYMSGLTFGTTSNIMRTPYASRVAWTFLGQTIDIRSGLSRCGELSRRSGEIDPIVRRMLGLDNPDISHTVVGFEPL